MSVRKTHEQYVDELAKKRPTIIPLEKYVRTDVKILHECKICGYQWQAAPMNVLVNYKDGCPKCAGNLKRTQEEYVKMLKNVNPNVEALGTYTGNNIKFLHKCLICGNQWDAYPSNLLSGKGGCPKCATLRSALKRRKPPKQYVEEVASITPEIGVVGTYINATTPILHRCSVCGYEWDGVPNRILSGCKCPKCTHHVQKTHGEYVVELKEKNPTIEVVEQYADSETPIMHHCLVHDIYWKQSPYNALKGYGCNECLKERIRTKLQKSQEQYVKDVKKINPDIEVVGKYVNNHTPILHRCLIGGHEWLTTPASIMRGNGCPICNESNGERQVRQWLEAHNIDYIRQYKNSECRDIHVLPFDFYLPKYNSCVEFDGTQHFEPVNWSGAMSEEDVLENFKNVQNHDDIKNRYCKDNGIGLLRISYFEDIESKLNNFLLG